MKYAKEVLKIARASKKIDNDCIVDIYQYSYKKGVEIKKRKISDIKVGDCFSVLSDNPYIKKIMNNDKIFMNCAISLDPKYSRRDWKGEVLPRFHFMKIK